MLRRNETKEKKTLINTLCNLVEIEQLSKSSIVSFKSNQPAAKLLFHHPLLVVYNQNEQKTNKQKNFYRKGIQIRIHREWPIIQKR